MSNAVGTFAVEDSFHITGRGLVLLGKITGEIAPGYQLVFQDATCWKIKAVESSREKIGLLVDAPLSSRDELLRRGIIWNAAQIFAP